MFILWIAGACLVVSAFLFFGIPLIMFGPRMVLRHVMSRSESKFLAGSLVAIGVSLFLATGSFIQTGNADTISAKNFYSLHAQA